MFERDYLMNLLMQFFRALMRANDLRHEKDDPEAASKMLEGAIQEAVEIDGAALLALAPDSIAQVMRVSDVDPNVTQFVARSLLLDSVYLTQADKPDMAALRLAQAHAIADEYGFGLPENPADFESITEGLEEAALAGGFDGREHDILDDLNLRW